MFVWVLVWLLGSPRGLEDGFYLTAKECEKAQEKKAKPEDWGCQPEKLDLT